MMKKRLTNYGKRFCSMVLIIAMLINLLPMEILAVENVDSMSESSVVSKESSELEMNETEDVYVLGEVTENRTQFSKEFQLSNGLHMTSIYAGAVHYEEDGEWEEIDNTLQLKNTTSGNAYTTTAGRWKVSFPQSMTEEKRITITKDGYEFRFWMDGELYDTGRRLDSTESTASEIEDNADTEEEIQSDSKEVTSKEVTSEEIASEEVSEIISDEIGDTDTSAGMLQENEMQIASKVYRMEPVQSSPAVVEQIDMEEFHKAEKYEETVAEKTFSRLRYDSVYENTDIVYDIDSVRVKESIVMEAYNENLSGYRYVLDVGNMVPYLTESNKIELYDAEKNEIVMVMPRPYLVDDAGEHCFDVDVTLQEVNEEYILAYTLPKEWLADEERVWPVVLDPVVEADTSAVNILDQSVASQTTFDVLDGVLNVGWRSERGIMRTFLAYEEIPELTSADVIVGAAVSMYKPYDSEVGAVVEVHKVTETWDCFTINWSNQADYNSIIEDFVNCQDAGYYTWDVTDIVREWYAGDNTGMMFKASNAVEAAATDNWKQFYSSDYGQYYRPTLLIMFRNNNGLESYWDYTSSSAGRAGTGYINDYTGNLVWIHDDIGFGGNRMPVSISHVYNANDSLNNTFGMGYGWRTNYNQRVYQWTSENAVGDYYVWEDADGTSHYFKKESSGVYKDEDGLELTLTTTGSGTTKYCIADKDSNTVF